MLLRILTQCYGYMFFIFVEFVGDSTIIDFPHTTHIYYEIIFHFDIWMSSPPISW